MSAYASVALANREPRHKSLYEGEEAGAGALPQFRRTGAGAYDYGAPLVQSERLTDLELGMQVAQTRWRLAANVYFMQFADEIVPSGGLDQFGVPRTGNADRTRHLGLELEVAARLAPGLDAYGNAAFSRSRFVRFVEYVTPLGVDRAGNPIAGFPSPVANVGVTYAWAGLRARLDLLHTGAQYVDNGGGVDAGGKKRAEYEVDAYALMNASLRYAFAPSSPAAGLELLLDINNVLNDRILLYGNEGFGAPQFFRRPRATFLQVRVIPCGSVLYTSFDWRMLIIVEKAFFGQTLHHCKRPVKCILPKSEGYLFQRSFPKIPHDRAPWLHAMTYRFAGLFSHPTSLGWRVRGHGLGRAVHPFHLLCIGFPWGITQNIGNRPVDCTCATGA